MREGLKVSYGGGFIIWIPAFVEIAQSIVDPGAWAVEAQETSGSLPGASVECCAAILASWSRAVRLHISWALTRLSSLPKHSFCQHKPVAIRLEICSQGSHDRPEQSHKVGLRSRRSMYLF